MEAYDKPILSSPELMNEATLEISGEYVPSSLPVIKKEPVWQMANMEVIIVLIITLISMMPKCPRLKLTTAPNLLAKFSPTTTALPVPALCMTRAPVLCLIMTLQSTLWRMSSQAGMCLCVKTGNLFGRVYRDSRGCC